MTKGHGYHSLLIRGRLDGAMRTLESLGCRIDNAEWLGTMIVLPMNSMNHHYVLLNEDGRIVSDFPVYNHRRATYAELMRGLFPDVLR